MRTHALRGALAALALLAAMQAAAAPTRRSRPPRAATQVLDPLRIRIMDGDTAEIRWAPADWETVRVLGIDTPELFEDRGRGGRRLSSRGVEARGFARGAFATANRVELRRAAGLDRYGHTLGYFMLDGRNYSVLALEAGLARETVTHYGDNGMPREAAEVRAAARRARPARAGRRATEP